MCTTRRFPGAAGPTVIIVLAALANPGCASDSPPEVVWGSPRNLGPNINSPGKEEHAVLPASGRTLYFASIREGGPGGYDIYVSHLENGEWSPAAPLPYPINTVRDEFDPFITPDGSQLFFASNRGNSEHYWDCDIYVSEWDSLGWSRPQLYDQQFAAPQVPDWGATAPADFEVFIFSSGRAPARSGSVQIFQSEWLGDGWSSPRALPPPVNSGGWEATPYITPDGKALYLNSGRGAEGKSDVDIWRFELEDGRWGNPTLMDGPFLSDAHDYDPFLAPDGRAFYFTSTREGGLGDADIYVVERVRRSPGSAPGGADRRP